MLPKIRVDPDLLEKLAGEIYRLAGDLNQAGDGLLNEVGRRIGATEYPDLQSSARGDAFSARDLINGIQRDLTGEADRLRLLSRAFRAVDDEAISFLTYQLGEAWLGQTFAGPRYPDLVGFEPYYVPQTAMATSDWAVMYDQNLKTALHTYKTGEFVENIVGTWTDPKTGQKYYVVDLGNGKYGYIPADRLSDPIDFSTIPAREGTFADGQTDLQLALPAPWGTDQWPEGWHSRGDPWQDLILGKTGIIGTRGAPVTRMTPHPNLCGPLSVLFALGETDIAGGLTKFAGLSNLGYFDKDHQWISQTGTDILEGGKPTGPDDLIKFIKQFDGWNATTGPGKMPTPSELEDKIKTGHKFIFLTELDTNKDIYQGGEKVPNPTSGQLVPGAPPNTPGRAAHWVTVTDVFQDSNGKIQVEVFNTYTGKPEIYSWDTFVKTCRQPGNNPGSYTYVEAWK